MRFLYIYVSTTTKSLTLLFDAVREAVNGGKNMELQQTVDTKPIISFVKEADS